MFPLYLLLTLALLSVMVIIHEFGHFIFAKIFGVTVLEFSVGMGPAIFTTGKKKKKKLQCADIEDEDDITDANSTPKKKKTAFSIRAFPVGGYVSMAGEDDDSEDPNAFNKKKVWQRMLIIIAGPAMNILLGILCMLIFVLNTAQINGGFLPSTQISNFVDGSTSNNAEVSKEPLMEKDIIIKVNGTYVLTGNDMIYEITNNGYQPIDLLVERNGEKITLHDVVFPNETNSGVTFGSFDFQIYGEKATFLTVAKHAVFNSFSTVKMIINSLIDLVTGRYGMEAVSGPIGVTGAVEDAAKSGGIISVLYLFTVITMNLGIFNLLPLPALDGGRMIFLLYELIVGTPVKKEVEQMINGIGFMLLMALALFISIKDIFGLF